MQNKTNKSPVNMAQINKIIAENQTGDSDSRIENKFTKINSLKLQRRIIQSISMGNFQKEA